MFNKNNFQSALFPALAILCVVLPSLGSSVSGYLLFENSGYYEFLKTHPFWFFILGTFTATLFILPTSFLAFLSAYAFSWHALPIYYIGYLFATSTSIFLLSYLPTHRFVSWLRSFPTFEIAINRLNGKSNAFILSSRLNPGLPFGLLNLIFASLKFSPIKTALVGLLGSLPRTILLFVTGTNAKELIELLNGTAEPSWILALLIAFLIIATFWKIRILFRK